MASFSLQTQHNISEVATSYIGPAAGQVKMTGTPSMRCNMPLPCAISNSFCAAVLWIQIRRFETSRAGERKRQVEAVKRAQVYRLATIGQFQTARRPRGNKNGAGAITSAFLAEQKSLSLRVRRLHILDLGGLL